MIRNFTLTILFLALGCTPAHSVTFDWAIVANPFNADDDTGFGGVNYTYNISKYEVTNTQYTEFLNAVDPTGANADLGGSDGLLYNESMSSDARGGINFNRAAANGSKFEIKSGRDNNPVVFVSFFDAMRFTNWLHNGQGSGSTESGVYTISDGLSEVRNPSARYFIPTEDEWYKAAYYDPTGGVYYDYPAGTDAEPYSDNPSSLNTPDDTNVANFFQIDSIANGFNDGYAATGSNSFVHSQNYLTDAGEYSLAESPYGTFDQGGNVWELNEAVVSSSIGGLRGGSWVNTSISLHAMLRLSIGPSNEFFTVGFRVASAIPEPSTMFLGVLSAAVLLMGRRRSCVPYVQRP